MRVAVECEMPVQSAQFGEGLPVVLIPGLQGRWEWMEDSVTSLASRCRVLTFSLPDGMNANGRQSETTLDTQVELIEQEMDRANIERAIICGVSYGGCVAVRFANARPHRVIGLVLVSTPGPDWRPDHRRATYLRAPRAWAPVFFARAARRLNRELVTAIPSRSQRLRFLSRFVRRVVRAPLSPDGMAARARGMIKVNLSHEAKFVRVPTLIITGEADLDSVVPVSSTREYLALIPHSRHVILEGTGHLGCITRPGRFASLVTSFADTIANEQVDALVSHEVPDAVGKLA